MAMLLNRFRNRGTRRKEPTAQEDKKKKKSDIPELSQFIDNKDYSGAISYIQFTQKNNDYDPFLELWLGHCYFRAGEIQKAQEVYEGLLSRGESSDEVYVYLGCCLYFLGLIKEAQSAANKGAKSALQNRLLLHIAHKQNDERELLKGHSQLKATIEDQLSLASLHFLRLHYHEALGVYTKIFEENRNFTALNVYIALCYYKLDFFDNALEFVKAYLASYPDSLAATNLLNCINFKLGQPVNIDTTAVDSYYSSVRLLFRHNQVIFSGGANALQVLPALIDMVPEAIINLTIYHLNREDVDAAYKLINDLDPQTPHEFLLKAITYLLVGQRNLSNDHINAAKSFFRIVGESTSECDTIVGRLSMAAHHFLSGRYEDVVVYLVSIKNYFYNDDRFNFNLGQTYVLTGRYDEAIQCLSEITRYNSPLLTQNLVRAYVMSRQPENAWDLFTKVRSPNEHPQLLKIIAHDSFETGQYACTARAFDALEKIDPSPDHWMGKRAAVAGQFMLLVKGKCSGKDMSEVLHYLQSGNHSQIESITNTIRKWARENGADLQ